MKKIKLIALIAALLVGIGAYQMIAELQKPVEIPKNTVIVAAMDIEENTKITEEMLTRTEVAVEDKHPDSETNLENIVGMVLSSKVYAGEQILASRLEAVGTNVGDTRELAYKVETGMRAVTVNVDSSSGVGNMVRAGDHVDVIMNYTHLQDKANEKGEKVEIPASIMSLQNVTVLAIGETLTKEKPETAYTTVTLQVTPEDAILLSYEEYSANARLILRSPVDEGTIEPTEVNKDTVRTVISKKK